jgi:hypothetical protein
MKEFMDICNTLDVEAPLPAAEAPASTAMPDAAWPSHLVPPGPSGWSWWRDAVLRSAGFPAALQSELSSPELGQCADALNGADRRLRALVVQAEQEVRQRIAVLRSAGDDGDKEAMRGLGRVQKSLKMLREGSGSTSTLQDLDPDLRRAIDEALEARKSASAAMELAFDDALAALEAAAARFAADPLFRSAVGWQNFEAVGTALDPLAQRAPMGGSKRRQREALIANYVQRYCVKNDSIGFFGPLAWMRIEDDPSAGRLDSGSGLVASRSVHFEDWAIVALASRLAADDRYLPYLVAGLEPYLCLEGQVLRLPGGTSISLDEAEARVLAMCDGRREVRALSRALLADPFGPFSEPAQVQDLLRTLQRASRVWLSFPIPSCQDNPDVPLRAHLERIGDTALRAEALGALDVLSSARQAVVDAAGDPQALARSLALLHEVFAAVVGGPQRRKQGEVYGGRSLVYEDCHRDLDFTLPRAALAPAPDALELVLTSARWFTSAAWRRFEEAFDAEFDRLLSRSAGAADIRLSDLWLHIQSIVFGNQVPLDDLAHELRDRWEAILIGKADITDSRIEFGLDDVRSRVLETFATDGAVWKLGRYHCPDVMFCARGHAEMLRGDYLAVLGEVHIGGNTLATNLFASQHPDRERLLDALRRDLGTPYVMPKLTPDASGTPTRTQWVDDAAHAIEIVFSRGFIAANPATARSISSLRVFREAAELRVRDGNWQASLADVLGDFLFIAVINRFGMLHKRDHTPRVTLGKLVVQRETWSFHARDLPFAQLADERAAFVAAQSWRTAHGLPAAVFLKMSWEAKPVHMDFGSVVSVRMLAKQLRRGIDEQQGAGGRLTFSEFLPALDELWLTDAAGQRYTSELRLVGIHADDVHAQSRACPR